MIVLNICVNGAYTNGFSYHENMLPKYHKFNGNDVYVLASKYEFNARGKLVHTDVCSFTDDYGVDVIRIDTKCHRSVNGRFKRFKHFYDTIETIKPDIIFCHLFQFLDLESVIRYAKKKNVVLFIDNHADLNNSGKNWLSKKILHGIIWRHLAQKALPYTEKFYGVTPARVDFLIDVYKLPKDKVELLPLGADDEMVEKAIDPVIRKNKRDEYGLTDDDFVIITGGKIDHNKPQIISFMEAVNKLGFPNVKLLVFGSIESEYRPAFDAQLSDRVKYIGWKRSDDIYYDFAAADLVVFPGLHSVLWEQAVGMGKPCIFKDIKGFHHVDLGGNCLFFENDGIDEYKLKIKEAIKNIDKMRNVAKSKGMIYFSYRKIAERSITVE